MKKWWINGLCMLMTGALTVFAVGCGDDSGNNSDTELTEEEQYDIIAPLVGATPGLVTQNLGTQFLDGVQAEDFTFNFFGLGKMLPPSLGKRLPDALLKPMQLEADTLIFGYNNGNGWWTFHVEYSLDIDTLGTSLDLTLSLDDSVRFETEAGAGQFEPNETTYRLRHEGSLGLNVAVNSDSLGSISVDLGGDNDFDMVGLDDEQVTINGSTEASIDFDYFDDTVDASVAMSLTGDLEDIIVDNAPESCPDEGLMTLGFEMDFDVTKGDENLEASGEWEIHVEFLGDGEAHVEVHAEDGDFEVESEESVCEPEE